MWKNRLMYLLLLGGIIIFFIDHSGWVSWFALLITLWLPLFSLVLSLPATIGKKVGISADVICRRLEENELALTMKRKNRIFSNFCKLTVMSRDLMSLADNSEKVILTHGSKYKVQISTEHCGVYEYELKKGRAYDFLGLFSFPVKLPKKLRVSVMPIPKSPEPRPDFASFYAKAYRPKPGGGFSEIHEMREYQAGDSLKAVNWKLSAKTDKLMVREAQEPERRVVMVTLSIVNDRAKMDATLDELMWVSMTLLEHEISHTVWVINSDKPELLSVTVDSEETLHTLIRNIMSTPMASGTPDTSVKLPKADWQYHIDPYRKEDANEA